VVEGDELYTKVKKTFPPRMLKGGPSYCWSGLLALSGNCGVDVENTPSMPIIWKPSMPPYAGGVRSIAEKPPPTPIKKKRLKPSLDVYVNPP
jgi:hypothetical protein